MTCCAVVAVDDFWRHKSCGGFWRQLDRHVAPCRRRTSADVNDRLSVVVRKWSDQINPPGQPGRRLDTPMDVRSQEKLESRCRSPKKLEPWYPNKLFESHAVRPPLLPGLGTGSAATAGAISLEAEEAGAAAMREVLRRWGELGDPLAYARRAVLSNFLKERTRWLDRVRRRLVEQSAGTAEGRTDATLTVWEDREWVLQMLLSLPPGQRAVMAFIVDGFTPAQISVLLGRSPAAFRPADKGEAGPSVCGDKRRGLRRAVAADHRRQMIGVLGGLRHQGREHCERETGSPAAAAARTRTSSRSSTDTGHDTSVVRRSEFQRRNGRSRVHEGGLGGCRKGRSLSVGC
jgi:hypothetical protein